MPCSACATNVVRRFLGSLDLSVSTRSPLHTAPNLYRTGARTFYNASSAPRKLSTAFSVVETSQPSGSIAVNYVSATSTNPAIDRNSFHQQNGIGGKTPTPVDSHVIQKEKDDQSAEGGGISARDDSAPLAENRKPQVKNPDSNALDKDWLEKNTRNLWAKNDRYRSAPKAVKHAGSAHNSDKLSDEPNLATQSTSPSANPTSPLPQSNTLDKDWWEEYSHILRYKKDRHRDNPKAAEHTESAQKGDQHSDDKPNPTTELPPLPQINPLDWQVQKYALTKKFPPGWVPRKRLSPDTVEGIRNLHAQYPTKYTTPVLADQFKVSPEAIRRILKSKWRPSDEEEEERRERWERRGKKIWEDLSEKGVKPPRKWRTLGVGKGKREGGWEKGPTRRERRMVEHVERERVKEGLKKGKGAVVVERAEGVYQVPLADRIL